MVVEGNRLYPIEIKKAKEPSHADRNFGALEKFKAAGIDVQPGIILCMSEEILPYNRGAWYCPIGAL